MEQIIGAKPQRGLHYAEIKQPTEGMYLIASIPDGRRQITASQKDFESGVAKNFRSLWNAYDKINVNGIKYFAPVINPKISNYYEVTGVFPVIPDNSRALRGGGRSIQKRRKKGKKVNRKS